MRWKATRCALVALAVGVVVVPVVGASPASDFAAIIKDYTGDRDVTPCLFTQAQLERARAELGADANAYSPGLFTEIGNEIKRWKDGGCTAKRVAAARGADVRITKVKAKGAAAKEYVTVRNYSRKAVSLRGYMLRDAGDHVIKLRKTSLKSKRSLTIVTGCRKGSKKPVRKGTRYYACRSKELWDDAGDVVELVNAKGGLLSLKTYGTPPA